MKKKLDYIRWVVLTVISIFVLNGQSVCADELYPGIYDGAGLLSETEKAALSDRIEALEAENQYHLIIRTTEDLQGKNTAAYADDFFEMNNGDGLKGSGLLFLIDMQNYEIYISTSGDRVIREFTDARLDSILDAAYESAVEGDFYQTCNRFLDGVAEKSFPPEGSLEGGTSDRRGRFRLSYILISLVVSLGLGRWIVWMMSHEKGGRVMTGANNYFLASGAQEIVHQDQFVRRTFFRRRIDRPNGSGSIGGSTVHRSGRGVVHGGRGRSFGGGSRGGGRRF